MNVVYFVAGSHQYIDYAKMSIETVQKFMPDANIHVFTDLDVNIPGAIVHWHGGPYENPLMVQNTMVWRDFCECEKGETIFLDPDVLMLRKPDLQFLRDLAFTWRVNLGQFSERMPWNTGVVFARCGNKTAKFFDDMVSRIQSMGMDSQKWYGNQEALAAMLGTPDRLLVDAWRNHRTALWVAREIAGAYVSELPCDLYNWTPDGDEPPMNRYFVHLKGNRKHRMKPMLNQLVSA